MITVDKMKFSFHASDLHWVQNLYAEWDSFCQKCTINIIEEELSSYDSEDRVVEIDNLKLDLGDINQDDFFEEFPIRLRNELRRLLNISPQLSQKTIHYEDVVKPHLIIEPITCWLSSPTLSRREKIELLIKTLRESPNIVLGFIHSPSEKSLLVTLSELLESPSVKQIIYAESRSHTEVGVPAYWFSLYEWLYKYYPWNGVAMFGDKESFGRHLNLKLLTFINKLRIGAYLTKGELTIQFILEIFGSEHYLEVLRVIYFNQTLDSNSRPIAGDYYTWEIYYILLKHSIITPNNREENSDPTIESLLENDSISLSQKQHIISQFITDEPNKVFEWIQSNIDRDHLKTTSSSLKQFIELIGEKKLLYLLSSNSSYRIASIVAKLLNYSSSRSDIINENFYITIIEWLSSHIDYTKYSEPNRVVLQELLYKLQKLLPSLDIEELASLFDSDVMYESKSLKEICSALTHAEHSRSDRQRIYINLLSKYQEDEIIFALVESNLLDDFIQTLPREIIRVLLLRFTQCSHPEARNIVEWIVTNDDLVAEILGCSTPTLLRRVIELQRAWSVERSSTNSDEITILKEFISGIILDRSDEIRVMRELTELSRRTNSRLFNLMLHFVECDSEYLDEVVGSQAIFNKDEQHKALVVKHYISRSPLRFLTQLKPLSKREVISLIDDSTIEREDIISCARGINNFIATTLISVTKKIEESVTRWGLFSGSSRELSSSLSKAMLLLLIEIHDSGRSLSSEYIISRLFSLWHFVLTGEEKIESSPAWQSAMEEVVESDLSIDKTEESEMKYSPLVPDNFEQFTSWLLSDLVEDSIKCEVISYYIKQSPQALWDYIRYSILNEYFSIRRLSRWLNIEGVICISASLSYQLYETIYYISIYLRNSRAISASELFEKMIHFLLNHSNSDLRSFSRETLRIKISEYFNIKTEAFTQSIARDDKFTEELIPEEDVKIEPQYISTSSGGLALLSPWFARLFAMVDLLDKEKRNFKSEEAKIRGVFILQHLVTPDRQRWRESELAFNRILVGLPFSTPLPAELKLSCDEVQAIESMLAGVKANWKVMANTSIKGFQNSFIARSGRIERRENSWRLHVEPRSYDMLLDSLPWSYTPIRLPWLKEWIDVQWRETQDFDC